MTCCIECHVRWEEEHALPYLPAPIQRWLLEEHARLEIAGFPIAEVKAHSEAEMRFFRRFCPAWVVEKCDADHAEVCPPRLGELPATLRTGHRIGQRTTPQLRAFVEGELKRCGCACADC